MLSCSCTFYQDFLKQHLHYHGDWRDLQRLVVTSEHALLPVTGGIGAYVQELAYLYSPRHTLVLFVGDAGAEPVTEVCQPEEFYPPGSLADFPRPDRAWAGVQQLLFYFPTLTAIEYQDYLGIGARIAQAKRAGLLGQRLHTEVLCHGNGAYLEHATQQWLDEPNWELRLLERVSIELADVIRFPTRFLHEFYLDRGFQFSIRSA